MLGLFFVCVKLGGRASRGRGIDSFPPFLWVSEPYHGLLNGFPGARNFERALPAAMPISAGSGGCETQGAVIGAPIGKRRRWRAVMGDANFR